MASKYDTFTWTLFGAGSGLGGLWLASGCGGACSGCLGCVASGATLATAALLRKHLPGKTKGDRDGMAATID